MQFTTKLEKIRQLKQSIKHCNYQKKLQGQMKLPDSNVLKNHAVSIGQKLSSNFSKTAKECNTVDYEKKVFVHFRNEQEISERLRCLKNQKSSSHADKSNEFSKCSFPIIELFIDRTFIEIFNSCLSPDCFKIAKVSFLHKKYTIRIPKTTNQSVCWGH